MESHAAAAAKSLQSCPTLCDPIDGSPPDSPIPGILQARILEWVAMPSSMGFSSQEHWSGLPFPPPMHESENEREVAQSCLTLCNSLHCSLPGSSVHGILQARIPEWFGGTRASRRVEEGLSMSFSGCSGKPSFPPTSAGDLRKLPRVPLRGE